ncbi:MAG: class I SAM-dependent methyltransferase [Planctomycetes bacterium]|nr:class I SAM-dependent methyltransferase [Planctomycetota bacterium]
MKPIYGRHFAAVYNDKWASWGAKMWPFIWKAVQRANPDASTWLDLCCGTGSLLKLARKHGFSTVGLDLSKHQLRHARRNLPDTEFIRGDVRALSLERKFDVITCLYDSLNYLRSARDLERVFRKVLRHLNPGGLFAFDVNTFTGLQDRWRGATLLDDSRSTVIIQSSFDAGRALGRCRIIGFLKTGRFYKKFDEEHWERGYHAREIETLLDTTGFDFKKYDADAFSRPSKRSGRLIYVCRPR